MSICVTADVIMLAHQALRAALCGACLLWTLTGFLYCAVSSFTSCHMLLNLSVDNARMGLAQADGDEGLAACDALNIEVIPTIQFWKNKQLLWEHRGVTALDQDLSEGSPTCVMPAICCQQFTACSYVDCYWATGESWCTCARAQASYVFCRRLVLRGPCSKWSEG